jgi:DNA-binding transcriptional ArsR family regulator
MRLTGAAATGGQPLHGFKAALFKALGHPLRLRMLELLRDGEMSVQDLLRELEVEPSTASQQLGILRSAGIVENRRAGSLVFYRLRDPLVVELLDVGRRVFANQVSDLQHEVAAAGRVDAKRSRRRVAPRRRPVRS